MELFEIIKEKRKVSRLTQQELAEKSGVGLRTIKLIESGIGNPSLSILTKLCATLNLEIIIQPKSKGLKN